MPRCSIACWRCWPSIAAPIRDHLPLSQVAQNRWWDRIDRAARTLETGFIVAILGGLIILGAAQIVLRNFFSIGFAWGDGLTRLAMDYMPKGVAIVGINSNDASAHPQDSPEQMIHEAEQRGYPFPYLYDETQEVAQAYGAACTPDFFVFDKQHKLVYRGQLDGSRPGNNVPVTGSDLRAALDAALAGKPLPEKQIPSIGCNIKWKAGSEPEYFDPVGVK